MPDRIPPARPAPPRAVVASRHMLPPSRAREAPTPGQLARRRFLVAWTKRLLPALALGLLAAVVFWPEIEGNEERSRVSFRRTVQPRAEALRVVNPRYQGVDELNRPFTITARAGQQEGAAEILNLEEPRGDMTMSDGAWIYVQSRTGRYDKPVGRLDMDTEGLLVCTNDGELSNRLAHPKHGVEKEYQAIVQGIPEEKALERLRKGVFVDGRKTAPARVEVIHAESKTGRTGLRITIHEGRKRQVRMMCEFVGHPVITLKRTRYGPLTLYKMRAGECRLLGQKEVNELRRLVGLSED
jgi:pseudouridine synthase